MGTFKDKVIIITGAAMGLGYATALEAAKNGVKLSLVDTMRASLNKAKDDILAVHAEAEILLSAAGVWDASAVKSYVDQTVKTYGRNDGFYNSAGIEGRQAPLVEDDLDVFKGC
jgi:NADP-dependent 3-hydroxy acid dehydrogenase YdfG